MSGAWTVTFSPPSGDRDTRWELEQHDNGTLTGEIELLQGSGSATDGWVEDDGTFGFTVTSDMRGQTVEIAYTGTVTDNTLEGSIKIIGFPFTADLIGVRAASKAIGNLAATAPEAAAWGYSNHR